MAKNLIVVLGATASGKTKLSTRLAYELKSEIISADSRQVYQGLDIGTGKDIKEYCINGNYISHHLIDIVAPQEEFNLFEFQKRFYEIFCGLLKKKIIPVLCGGTGLYLESVLLDYDLPPAPADENYRKKLNKRSIEELRQILIGLKNRLHNNTDFENKDRLIRAIEIEKARAIKSAESFNKPIINAVVVGIYWERSVLRDLITARLQQRLENGMMEEVKSLHESGLSWARLDSLGLEYRYLSYFLRGEINYAEMFSKLNTSIHQFAKRQETWFRRMERKGIKINWIRGDDYDSLKEIVYRNLNE